MSVGFSFAQNKSASAVTGRSVFESLSHRDHFLGAGGVDGHGGVEVGLGGAHFYGHAEVLKASK